MNTLKMKTKPQRKVSWQCLLLTQKDIMADRKEVLVANSLTWRPGDVGFITAF